MGTMANLSAKWGTVHCKHIFEMKSAPTPRVTVKKLKALPQRLSKYYQF